MFGLPEDDFQSMQETLKLSLDLNCEFGNFYCASAYPGSKLYTWAVENNIQLPESWEGYAQHNYNFLSLPTKTLSPKEVLEYRDYAFDVYFKNPIYLKMIEERFGIVARKHIEEMTKIKLKRKLLGD